MLAVIAWTVLKLFNFKTKGWGSKAFPGLNRVKLSSPILILGLIFLNFAKPESKLNLHLSDKTLSLWQRQIIRPLVFAPLPVLGHGRDWVWFEKFCESSWVLSAAADNTLRSKSAQFFISYKRQKPGQIYLLSIKNIPSLKPVQPHSM